MLTCYSSITTCFKGIKSEIHRFFFYTNQPTLCARLHIVVNVIAVVILGLVNDDKTSVMFIFMETFQVYNKVKAGRSAQEVAAVHFF